MRARSAGGSVGDEEEEQVERSCMTAENLPSVDNQAASLPAAIPLSPTLALAILKAGQVTCGRLWLLLRHLDRDGRGWLESEAVYSALAGEGSDLHLCSRRHLARLLDEGEGLFWTAGSSGSGKDGRIWLHSQARVAGALGIEKLTGRPVALPVSILLGPIGRLRAHFYASFHSGRAGEQDYGSPIGRGTLEAMTGVPRRTQQVYDRRAGVRVRSNIALGPAVSSGPETTMSPLPSSSAGQELAWQYGRAYFPFTDHRGKSGRAGRTYHAWRLPNSYQGPHACLPRGRQRRLNRQLADLGMKRGAGNGRAAERPDRCFFPHGAAAVRAWSRREAVVVYWPCKGSGRWLVWAVVDGRVM
jgi:hypothetical protein